MEESNAEKYRWLVNRIARKTKVKKPVIEEVLGAIADIRWDWMGSKYDIHGVCLEDVFSDLGVDRCPKNLVDDRL